jgi:hypothetical protein
MKTFKALASNDADSETLFVYNSEGRGLTGGIRSVARFDAMSSNIADIAKVCPLKRENQG